MGNPLQFLDVVAQVHRRRYGEHGELFAVKISRKTCAALLGPARKNWPLRQTDGRENLIELIVTTTQHFKILAQ